MRLADVLLLARLCYAGLALSAISPPLRVVLLVRMMLLLMLTSTFT